MLQNIARNIKKPLCDNDIVRWTNAKVIMLAKKAKCVLQCPTCMYLYLSTM